MSDRPGEVDKTSLISPGLATAPDVEETDAQEVPWSEKGHVEVRKMQDSIERTLNNAMADLREQYRLHRMGEKSRVPSPSAASDENQSSTSGGDHRSTPTVRAGRDSRDSGSLLGTLADDAALLGVKSEAAAVRDEMLDGLSRLRRDLEAQRGHRSTPAPVAVGSGSSTGSTSATATAAAVAAATAGSSNSSRVDRKVAAVEAAIIELRGDFSGIQAILREQQVVIQDVHRDAIAKHEMALSKMASFEQALGTLRNEVRLVQEHPLPIPANDAPKKVGEACPSAQQVAGSMSRLESSLRSEFDVMWGMVEDLRNQMQERLSQSVTSTGMSALASRVERLETQQQTLLPVATPTVTAVPVAGSQMPSSLGSSEKSTPMAGGRALAEVDSKTQARIQSIEERLSGLETQGDLAQFLDPDKSTVQQGDKAFVSENLKVTLERLLQKVNNTLLPAAAQAITADLVSATARDAADEPQAPSPRRRGFSQGRPQGAATPAAPAAPVHINTPQLSGAGGAPAGARAAPQSLRQAASAQANAGRMNTVVRGVSTPHLSRPGSRVASVERSLLAAPVLGNFAPLAASGHATPMPALDNTYIDTAQEQMFPRPSRGAGSPIPANRQMARQASSAMRVAGSSSPRRAS